MPARARTCAWSALLGERWGRSTRNIKETIRSAACLRTQELRCAVDDPGALRAVLPELSRLRDARLAEANNRHPKALAAQPLEQVAAEVAHLIREVRPQVVLTFDPIGGYRHPDHIAIQKATVQAFSLAASPEFMPTRTGLPRVPAGHSLFPYDEQDLSEDGRGRAMRLIWTQNPREFGRKIRILTWSR